jgi:hypothetical protein
MRFKPEARCPLSLLVFGWGLGQDNDKGKKVPVSAYRIKLIAAT